MDAKWWEVVPSGATLAKINPADGTAIFTFQGKTLCCDLFTDTVTAMNSTTENNLTIDEWHSTSKERWKEAVANRSVVYGYDEWKRRYAPAQLVAIGKVDVYVYIDPVNSRGNKVIVDDCSLGDSDDMRIVYASHEEVPTNIIPDETSLAHAKEVLDGKILTDWPAWEFGW